MIGFPDLRQYVCLVVLMGTCVVQAADLQTFGAVIARRDSVDRQAFVDDMEVVARLGDVRAAVLIGMIRLDPGYGPPDRVAGLAWLKVASQIDVWNEGTFEEAPQTLHRLEPQFSAGEYQAASERANSILAPLVQRRQSRLDEARESLLDPGRLSADNSKAGVALLHRGKGGTGCAGLLPEPDTKASTRRAGAKIVQPAFPISEVELGQDRDVVFAAHVDGSGYVCHVIILESSGLLELDSAVLDAAARWRWAPAMKDGKPIESIEVGQASFTTRSGSVAAYNGTRALLNELTQAVVGN